MGLNIVSDDGKVDIWVGGFGAFMRFRAEIAGHHGAKEMAKHFSGAKYRKGNEAMLDEPTLGFDAIWEDKAMIAEQKHIKEKQPKLWTFIAHYDDRGYWTASECKEVLFVVKKALPKLPKEKEEGHIGDWNTKATTFIKGLQYCVDHKFKAVFC